MSKIQIKLVRSVIGTTPNQRKNVEALGLKIRGMINKVSHLVEVTEIAE